ncbi:glycosyltransferase family 2 protein [Rhizobacter sp. LjRoot28]|jgi:glycosyltransferase involved in cell wall biosynthesis|uniref:glycosyltransferase family 2 protein n=1 Tax=Rhizobacter sp. LjRoot28 TaxID=3342309 RepID=UPI003ED072FC
MLDSNALVSVVIPNYNYESFVGAAIESALALDWPNVQVIVVDDGSTDGSRIVIGRYAERIETVLQPNAGQLAACNAGFARARGEVVFFLDSDDMLHPSVVRRLAPLWHAGVSKVQFQMRSVDAQGRALGGVFPQFPAVTPSPEEITRWSLTTSAYPTPPGSGNAYARSFLEKIFPQDESGGTTIADSGPLAAAPFLGDVLTVPEPLVSYRVHGKNDGAMSQIDGAKFAREVSRTQARFAYAQRIARSVGLDMKDSALDRSLSYLPYRLASLRLVPGQHPIPGDNRFKLLADVAAAAMAPQGVSGKGRITLVVWSLLVALLPLSAARKLILWRFAPGARPQALRNALVRLRVIR